MCKLFPHTQDEKNRRIELLTEKLTEIVSRYELLINLKVLHHWLRN